MGVFENVKAEGVQRAIDFFAKAGIAESRDYFLYMRAARHRLFGHSLNHVALNEPN